MTIPMRFVTVVIAVLAMIGFGTGSAAAETANGGMAPLTKVFRACDFDVTKFLSATGYGTGHSVIGTGGSNTVTADVSLAIGTPNTAYEVRLIQLPRPGTQPCIPGQPGVAGAILHTDGNGTGAVTLRDAVAPGATAAWVFVEGPPDPGEIRGEFYTSETATSLK